MLTPRRLPGDHFNNSAADTPDVALAAVTSLPDNLGRHECWRPAQRLRALTLASRIPKFAKISARSEVREFRFSRPVNKDVCTLLNDSTYLRDGLASHPRPSCLYVSVHHAVGVEEG